MSPRGLWVGVMERGWKEGLTSLPWNLKFLVEIFVVVEAGNISHETSLDVWIEDHIVEGTAFNTLPEITTLLPAILVKDIDIVLESTAPSPDSKHNLIRKRSFILILLLILAGNENKKELNDPSIWLFRLHLVEDILVALPDIVPATKLDFVPDLTSFTANSGNWVLAIESLSIVCLVGVSGQSGQASFGETFEVPSTVFCMSDMVIGIYLAEVLQVGEEGIDTSATVVITVSLVDHLVLFRIHDDGSGIEKKWSIKR